MMMKSFSKHNRVIDPYEKSPIQVSTILDMPCFIHFLDYETYLSFEDKIIENYRDCDIAATPPLVVYGKDAKLFSHPLIIDALKVGADFCRRFYRNTRRRAKRKEVLCSYT